jgi:serine/threonine protein kinase
MVLGRFRLIEKVDASEAAASYTAVNGDVSAWIELLGAEVADTAIQRLKDQRKLLASLKKAKAPELIEFGEDERRTFVAVRRQPGETLASRIRRGSLGAIETLDLLIELADALAETHALGIAHGKLTAKNIYFAAGGMREQIEILGFGLAGLSSSVSEQPTPQDDLRALGRVGYLCLAGPEAESADPPIKVLEKQPHLSKEVRDLVLRLMEGDGLGSANDLAELARAARKVVTTAIAPVKPTQRDAAKIEVVLRTTIEAANAGEEDATPVPMLAYERPLPVRPRDPSQPRPPPPPAKPRPIDAKTLFIAGAIVILLIIGLWFITTAGDSPGEVTVESIGSE